jgi:hypothetical protein
MESILKTISLEPMDITYLGIGSCPHIGEQEKLESKYDQLIPQCFHELLLREKKHFRILHFDPCFDRYKPFLDSYFENWNLVPMEIHGGYSWIGESMEVIVIPQSIEQKDHFWFFETLCETILNTKGKLVIQEYTGYEMKDLEMKLFESTSQKEKFKRRILIDMTYGTDTGCCTDMTKAQPFYDYNGDFINLSFLNQKDATRWAGISMKLDDILRKKYMTKFLLALNYIHVDYRRRLKGESCMYTNTDYTNTSTPDEIMSVLQKHLREEFEVLLATKLVTLDQKETLETLFRDYKQYDPYKWYDCVNKLIPRA